VQIQFYIKGPSGTGLVHADMYKDESKEWQYSYLLVDAYSAGSSQPSRLHIIKPPN
jgi:import inner membrane translocase subunit TIM21